MRYESIGFDKTDQGMLYTVKLGHREEPDEGDIVEIDYRPYIVLGVERVSPKFAALTVRRATTPDLIRAYGEPREDQQFCGGCGQIILADSSGHTLCYSCFWGRDSD